MHFRNHSEMSELKINNKFIYKIQPQGNSEHKGCALQMIST